MAEDPREVLEQERATRSLHCEEEKQKKGSSLTCGQCGGDIDEVVVYVCGDHYICRICDKENLQAVK